MPHSYTRSPPKQIREMNNVRIPFSLHLKFLFLPGVNGVDMRMGTRALEVHVRSFSTKTSPA